MLSLLLDDLLSKHRKDRGDHVAIVDVTQSWTYGQVDRAADTLAAYLRRAGVRRGDRVGISMAKCAEEIVATFAIARLGAVVVNVHPQRLASHLRYVIEHAEIRVLVASHKRASELLDATCPSVLARIIVHGRRLDDPRAESWPAPTDEPTSLPPPPGIDRDPAAIVYTSGSTGAAKGVVWTHANLLAGARAVARQLANHADDRLLAALPLSFVYGMSQLTTAFLSGATLVLLPLAVPAEILRMLRTQAITGFAATPAMLGPLTRLMLTQPTPLPALRYVTNSGGSLPRAVLDALPTVFSDQRLFLFYGSTEAFRGTHVPPERYTDKKGAIGVACPNAEIFVVGPDDKLCEPGQQGELLQRGATVAAGYWRDPEATRAKFRPSAALAQRIGDEPVCHTGDIVRIDDDGYLWFVGRNDWLIKSGGFRVSPGEIEDAVLASALVHDAVAFGVPADEIGEAIHLAVTLVHADEVAADQLRAHVRRHLPGHMQPREIHFFSGELPRNAHGKIDRPAVVRACTAPGGGGGATELR